MDNFINDPVMDLTTKTMKNDILLFKNETLKDFKLAQKKIIDKYSTLDNNIKSKFEEYDKKINSYEIKITELSNLISTDKSIKEKIEQLLEFKEKTNDTLMREKIRLDNFRNDLNANVTRIDKILTDSVIYPGVIGGINKYKTFHELIDYILTQCSLNISFREKYILDFKGYKTKLEGLIEVFNGQINKILETTSEYTRTYVKESEDKLKSMFSILEDRLSDTRVENANYAVGLEKISKTLQNDLKNLDTIKNELYQKVDSSVADMRKDNAKIIKLFSGYRKGFNLLQHKFTQLSEFIKDMRFRINLKEDVERREFAKMSDLINFDKKKKGFYEGLGELIKNNKGFESQIKDYINGKISAEELLKRYNSMSNIKDFQRKSVGGENLSSFKKFNSFGSDIIESDKNSLSSLLRGSMAMPKKKYTLENDISKNDKKKKHEEIKEEDEEDILSNHELNSGNGLQRKGSLNKNYQNKDKKEKDSFFDSLYEDVNVEDEEEKNNLNKNISGSNNNSFGKSKHGRGSIRNNMVTVYKAEKLIKNMKKLNPDINYINNININKEKSKEKEQRNININIQNNNKGQDSHYSDPNEETKNNKVLNSDNYKNTPKIIENNNSTNKSSTLYDFKLKNMGEQAFKSKNKISPKLKKVESADRYRHKRKDEIQNKEIDKKIQKIRMIKDSLYESEFILPSNIVHNATIIAIKSKDDNNIKKKKISPEKSFHKSEIKSVGHLILTSFYPKKNKHDLNADEKNILKIGLTKK